MNEIVIVILNTLTRFNIVYAVRGKWSGTVVVN